MKLTRIVTAAALVLAVNAPASAQQVTLNFDDLGSCAGALASYGGWLNIASGVNCQTGNSYYTQAKSAQNYMRSNGAMDWSFTGGPVVFNGMWASGYGTYFVEFYRNGAKMHQSTFDAYGNGTVFVGGGYSGDVDRVKIGLVGGLNHLGVDDVSFTKSTTQETPAGPVDNLVNQPNATPEPATMLLMASGLGGLGAMMRRRRKAAGLQSE